MPSRSFTLHRFCLDTIPGALFEGYTEGDTWNGWACPYFSRPVAESILMASEKNGYRWQYKPDKDEFEVTHADDDANSPAEKFRPIQAETEGHSVTLYGIGTYSWTWVECENE